ncbi:MAG: putative rRNA (Uracil-5-)-methyltransferase [Rickettsiaceae bacterium]|jgi:23S rRNA (uracil1939-C5)-methyltransferase|nr:putative rRNA (Uracil-5-)-methyltransferase [Rickettsiaceae bacterium]
MAITEQSKCTIKHLNNQGLGVGRTNIGEVLLPNTLPGEEVSFERHEYRAQTNFILKEIITESLERVSPPCKYFGACGGCLLQHLNEEAYREFKLKQLKNTLSSANIETIINDLITIPPGHRRRANFEAIKKNDQIYLGFKRFHSHQIINIEECPALSTELSQLIPALKNILIEVLKPQEKIQIFLTQADNGIDILIEGKEQWNFNKDKLEIFNIFAIKYKIIRLTYSYNNRSVIIVDITTPYVLFDNIKVEVNAKCFLQSSDLSDKILSDKIIEYLQSSSLPKKIVDLFCGRGTFTLPLSKYAEVHAYESDTAALSALQQATNESNRSIKNMMRDLFKSPLNSQELNLYDFCVINPPRAGAKAQCAELSKSNIERIIYISCNPETFARDAKILISGGYQVIEVTPVDQFYWNPHLEVVGYFERVR